MIKLHRCKYCNKLVLSIFRKVNKDICKYCYISKSNILRIGASVIDFDITNSMKYNQEFNELANDVWGTKDVKYI